MRSPQTQPKAALNPGLLPLSHVAKQQVMSPSVSESNIRNGFLNVGCTQFKMNLIWKGVAVWITGGEMQRGLCELKVWELSSYWLFNSDMDVWTASLHCKGPNRLKPHFAVFCQVYDTLLQFANAFFVNPLLMESVCDDICILCKCLAFFFCLTVIKEYVWH